MKLYEKLDHLAHWCKYQSTYLEMEYYLKQVLNGKEKCYIKPIHFYDRNIGKSTALARLSVKYNIPIVVSTEISKNIIGRDIPRYFPRYFKKKYPNVLIANDNMRGIKKDVLLAEEGLSYEQIGMVDNACNGKIVGYMRCN